MGMVLFNYSAKELTAKVVYYGPGLCGKTTNLQVIYNSLPQSVKGKMLSLSTKTDRTLFFDFLPLDLGEIAGMKTRIQLYTVPGQVFYNETRRLVLKGSDGIVFVADSQAHLLNANIESLNNLEDNLKTHGMSLKDMPLVLQFNKRDLPSLSSTEEMNLAINKYNAPFYESVATTGIGVQDTLRAITKLVLIHLSKKFDLKIPSQIEEKKKVEEEEGIDVEKVPQTVGVAQHQEESISYSSEDQSEIPTDAISDMSIEPSSEEPEIVATQEEPIEQIETIEEQTEEKEPVTETSGWLPQEESAEDEIPSMPAESIPDQSLQAGEDQLPFMPTQDQSETELTFEEDAQITPSPDQPIAEDQEPQEVEISIPENLEESERIEEKETETESSSLPRVSEEIPSEEPKEVIAEAAEESIEEETPETSQESTVEFEIKEEIPHPEVAESAQERETVQISPGKEHEVNIPLTLGAGKNKKQFRLRISFKFEEDEQ